MRTVEVTQFNDTQLEVIRRRVDVTTAYRESTGREVLAYTSSQSTNGYIVTAFKGKLWRCRWPMGHTVGRALRENALGTV